MTKRRRLNRLAAALLAAVVALLAAQPTFGQATSQPTDQAPELGINRVPELGTDRGTDQVTDQAASDLMPLTPSIPAPPNSARSLPIQTSAPVLSPRFPSDTGFLLPPRPIFPEVQSTALQLVLRLSDRRVYLYRGDDVEVSYPVAVGKGGWETPTGSYEVMTMIENPSWENPFTGGVIPAGPDNPLGERWIGFWTDGRNFIGFHGTPNESSVGRAASHGCVRMYNRDIKELFALVTVGTPVTVEP